MLFGYGGVLSSSQIADGVEAREASDLVARELPAAPPSFMLLFTSDTLRVNDPAYRAEVERALKPITGSADVSRVRTAWQTNTLDPSYVSTDGRSTYALVELHDKEWAELVETYDRVRPQVSSDSLDVLAAGTLPLNADFTETTEQDLRRAEIVSLPLVLLMLLLVFGSVVAAGLPIGVGLLAVGVGFVGTLLLARVTDVSIYATNVVTMIGLGVAIDYSLFVVSRFREESTHLPIPEALARTMATTGRAVAFSGLTVAIGLLGLTFFRLGFLSSMGLAGTIVVALAVLYALTFLPALLAVLGRRVDSLRIPLIQRAPREEGSHVWRRIAHAVMARPWRVLAPTAAVLLLLGTPALSLRLGAADETSLPQRVESRRGAELLRDGFPGRGASPVVVVLHYAAAAGFGPDRAAQLYDAGRWLAAQPGASRVESVVNLDPSLGKAAYQQMYSQPPDQLAPAVQEALAGSVSERVSVLRVYPDEGPGSDSARELVAAVRNHNFGISGEVLVTGQTAYDVDVIALIAADAPKAIGFIMVATYIVLFLLLGSILLPLKAVLMNLLSISASYGALVWIFQEGHFSDLLNFTPGPVETTIPVLMFCILFGLSMDYEVLLLSRVKEEYERSGDNTHAVAVSLERTGRLITSAAIIMAGVFFSFGLADTVIIKAIGIGMGIAVALDATVVRALLVPAAMRLMGRWNWWAPAPLARLHNRLGFAERTAHEPGYSADTSELQA